MFDVSDRALRATLARYTLGLSPRAMMAVYLDWATGLALSPGKQAQLFDKAFRKVAKFTHYSWSRTLNPLEAGCCIDPLPQDKRFTGAAWQQYPFDLIYQSFLLTQQWWYNATAGVDGVSPPHQRVIEFAARQWLDIFSPANLIATNPEVLEATLKEGGQNLVRGWQNLIEDMERAASGQKPLGAEAFCVGKDVAVTPGKIVYRNDLIELIQYSPTTETVYAEPVLIVPAWIMKYYILDLSAQNSLVKYLVDHGHTVFMVSWKNPDADDRDLGLDDYRQLGVNDAVDAITSIIPDQPIHGVGYCLGGTLLTIAAAAKSRDGDDRFGSLTFLATQVDFEEAGELMLFIDDKQVSFLEDMMWERGYLDTHQMAGAFQMLRSNDLIWSKMIHDYLMGLRKPLTDLMAWNADTTRMPYKMHSEYLRKMFLDNDLSEGRYRVDGKPAIISDIRVPMFVVATETDHVAPWHSVYKFHLLANAEITFLLTTGGHNVGIVSDPQYPNRSYRMRTSLPTDHYIGPDRWFDETPVQDGTWWPDWQRWLGQNSGNQIAPPSMGQNDGLSSTLDDAPGSYVLQE